MSKVYNYLNTMKDARPSLFASHPWYQLSLVPRKRDNNILMPEVLFFGNLMTLKVVAVEPKPPCIVVFLQQSHLHLSYAGDTKFSDTYFLAGHTTKYVSNQGSHHSSVT